MLVLENDSADDLWSNAWVAVLDGPGTVRDNIAKGPSHETLHAVLALTDPRQRWVTSRVPAINPAFAIAEVIWILRGRSDAAFLTAWNRSLPKYSGKSEILDGAYGERLRHRFGVDQLLRASSILRTRPEQRQVVLQIWDPLRDLPDDTGESASPDVPCNVVSILKCVDGRLDWLQVMRSNDLVRGLPYNLVQWTTLQEILAGWIGVEVGHYVHVSDSLHVYHDDLGRFTSNDARIKYRNEDDLRLDIQKSEQVFTVLEEAVSQIAGADSLGGVIEHVQSLDQEGYSDWLRVMGAERLRRLTIADAATDMARSISNPLLRHAVGNWFRRCGSIE
ncbi:thymidylate synthase [Sinomonas sp. P10A9]|uniref:thymidylate synthase n=1 Tax=Sinomonas puerhi TaxID=3238584 RepID=A0AB39L2L5_9MICC